MVRPAARLVAVLLWLAATGAAADTARERLVLETRTGAHEFHVEVARTTDQRRRGLMGRTDLGPADGMLFDFRGLAGVAMWMKDTPTALDMVFIGAGGRVLGIAADTVPYSQTVIRAPAGTGAVLEVIAGTARRIGLEPGDAVIHVMFGAP